MFLLSTVFYLS